jgi:radical SAM enzyme (TIGR01210 family)
MNSTPDPSPRALDAWLLGLRPAKNRVDPTRPYACLVEKERADSGRIDDVATIFLTNRECPLRCLMCDLWKNTTDHPVAPGDIPTQIRWALSRLPPARHIKLYNSGNFFDPHAIPEIDYPEIAEIVAPFETVVVESHPRMIGRRFRAFRNMIPGRLEVAMGLETVHPDVLPRLNKRMTLDDFARAAGALRDRGASVRAFILLRPPFLTESEGVFWAKRSLDFAFDVGCGCCTVIPTRVGNGAMESLARQGKFQPPTLESLEEVLEYGIRLNRGRVFADLWNIESIVGESPEQRARGERLARMNLTQEREPAIDFPRTERYAQGRL